MRDGSNLVSILKILGASLTHLQFVAESFIFLESQKSWLRILEIQKCFSSLYISNIIKRFLGEFHPKSRLLELHCCFSATPIWRVSRWIFYRVNYRFGVLLFYSFGLFSIPTTLSCNGSSFYITRWEKWVKKSRLVHNPRSLFLSVINARKEGFFWGILGWCLRSKRTRSHHFLVVWAINHIISSRTGANSF